jgi:heme exporter protein A
VTAPGVAVRGVGHAYGERVVLRDLDLDVPAGSSLAVFGPNGAGKSTLLRIVAGLLRPLRGSATLDGARLADAGPELRRRVGYVGHRPLVWGGLTCAENLELYARLYGLSAGAGAAALARVGLAERAGDPARSLSQGMGQRLGLARALLHEPDLLVLDEPHASLDADGAALVDGVIEAARGRTTLVLATHDRERGRALCAQTATLERGERVG